MADRRFAHVLSVQAIKSRAAAPLYWSVEPGIMDRCLAAWSSSRASLEAMRVPHQYVMRARRNGFCCTVHRCPCLCFRKQRTLGDIGELPAALDGRFLVGRDGHALLVEFGADRLKGEICARHVKISANAARSGIPRNEKQRDAGPSCSS